MSLEKKYFSSLGVYVNYDSIFRDKFSEAFNNLKEIYFEDPFFFKDQFSFENVKNFSGVENYSIAEVFFILKDINFKEKNSYLFLIEDEGVVKIFYFYKISNTEYSIDIYGGKTNSCFDKETAVFIKNKNIN